MADIHSPARHTQTASMEHRLERSEQPSTLLKLRDKLRSNPTVTTMEHEDETPDHDLTGTFNQQTADAIRDAWACAINNTDKQPIRELYRANRHEGFRALIAELMRDV